MVIGMDSMDIMDWMDLPSPEALPRAGEKEVLSA
jgi:hypothetical protein